MKFDTLVLDYESYWSNDYSLSKMNTVRYVRDQRFKYHGAALKLNGAPAEWVTGSHLKSVLQNDIDWSKTLLIGHNLPFDGLILAEIDECWPTVYVDTLGMARCVLGGTVPSRSLDAVAQHYGHVGKLEKGGALYATKGVRDLSPEQERTLAAYACQDAEQTALIFRSMWPEFPKKMLATLDWTVRMMTQPGIVLNADVMRECHETEVEIKRNAVANCRLTKTQLNSNKQFADILREHGIEPPTKISRTTGKETYAFSKVDQEFVDLQDDPNTDVRDLVLARLAVKSSIEETRSKAYLELAEGGKLCPVPLAFCGAMQTGRLSGQEGLNWQNVGRSSKMRDGVEAPDGYVFVEADSSNIELRVVAKFCGQDDLVETLRVGGDAYSDFATTLFGVPVTKALTKTDPVIANYRQTGKVAMLSSQYRVGARTFQKMLWVQAGLRIDEDEAERINTLYRKTYRGISDMWKRLDKQLQIMATGAVPPDLDPTHPIVWHSDSIELPSGFKLKYPDLRYITDQQTGRKSLAFTFFGGKSNGLKYVHGGTLLENLGQSLAREIIDPQVQKIRRRYPVLLQVHDAVLALVPETEAEEGVAYVRECMSEAPSWWSGIPIACEAGYGKTYGGIKKT